MKKMKKKRKSCYIQTFSSVPGKNILHTKNISHERERRERKRDRKAGTGAISWVKLMMK